MKGLQVLVFVFAFMVILSVQSVSAIFVPIEVSITPEYIETDLETAAVFLLNVKNNEDARETLKATVSGPHIHWATSPIILLVVPKNTSKQFNLTFYPVEERGTFDFNITMESYRNPTVKETRTITIYIPPIFALNDVSVSREGDDVVAAFDVKTIRQMETYIMMNIFDDGGHLISTSENSYEVDGEEIITHTVPLPENPMAGEYTLTYTINENITGRHVFTVEAIHKMERTETLVAGALSGEVTVTYKNLGNVVESNYVVQKEMPSDAITGFITKPEGCIDEAGKRVCDYVLPELRPGATARIAYRIEYWPVYAQILAAVVIAAIIIGFSFVRATKPSIGKSSVKKNRDTHSVILEIKNPFLHHLKDVVIRDWVSPLAKVMHEEIDAVKPVLKKSEAGTELIWKLGDIRPKEVRYLSYKIKTLVEGNLKMPRAYARFRTPKGSRSRVYSKYIDLR